MPTDAEAAHTAVALGHPGSWNQQSDALGLGTALVAEVQRLPGNLIKISIGLLKN